MLIAGLDLAAEPKGTALAVLNLSGKHAELVSLTQSVSDEAIVHASRDWQKLGIDCALGWPIQFVDFVSSYNQSSLTGLTFDGGIDWRRSLAHRETDREVRRVTGRWPLSVSTDRLGMTAMRCAGLLTKLEASGVSIDRSGKGKIVEIYPAASMRLWGLQIAGYRASSEIREQLIAQLETAAPWLNLDGFSDLMVKSCDSFDAVIAALATTSNALGQSSSPPADKLKIAQIEGWVSLPLKPLSEMIS